MKIYISGKMGRHIDGDIKSKFFKAYFETLEKFNFKSSVEVVNPASDVYQASLRNWLDSYAVSSLETGQPYNLYAETLLWDFDKIRECDAIYMLKDWMDSPGARAEHAFAKAIGLEVMYEEPPVDISIRDIVAEIVDAGEQSNAGKCFVKYEKILHRDWDLIITVRRHKENE